MKAKVIKKVPRGATIYVPVEILKKLQLTPGEDYIEYVAQKNGKIVIQKAKEE